MRSYSQPCRRVCVSRAQMTRTSNCARSSWSFVGCTSKGGGIWSMALSTCARCPRRHMLSWVIRAPGSGGSRTLRRRRPCAEAWRTRFGGARKRNQAQGASSQGASPAGPRWPPRLPFRSRPAICRSWTANGRCLERKKGQIQCVFPPPPKLGQASSQQLFLFRWPSSVQP